MSRLSKSIQADDAEVLVAARKLTAEDHGKTFFLSLAGGFNVTLPPVALGLKFKFVVKTAPTTAYTITSVDYAGSAANLIKGHVLTTDVNSATDPDFDTTAIDVLTFVANKAVAGDVCELECDGTNWFYSARVSVFDAFTGA
ncbi:MAG TPA: hypothetical protein VFW03_13675 [Gemmatimonadaceae bacterium]|nr:hypothetical protein [Gemmatimonadaceae bacterium]